MTTSAPDPLHPLPRLADALIEVSARLRDIGDEIRTMQPPAPPAPQPHPQQPPPTAAPAPGPFWGPPPPVPPWAGRYPSGPGYPPPPPYRVQRGYAAPPPPPNFSPPLAPSAVPNRPPQYPHAAAPRPHPPVTLWDRLSKEGAGSRLLAWVGGGVTLAGLVLLLVLAVQRGYVGPLPRVLLGAALGSTLVLVGLLLHRKESGRIGALAVAATGFAGLFFDVVAATSIYSYLPVPAGLVIGLAVAGAGAAVAMRWDSQVFAVFAVLGCALTAPVLTHGVDATLVGFLLTLQIATAPVHLSKRWTGLALAGGVPPVIAILAETAIVRVHASGVNGATVLALCVITGIVQVVFATATMLRDTASSIGVGLLLSGAVPTLLGASLVTRPSGAVAVGALGALFLLVWTLHHTGLLRVPDPFAAAAGGAGAVAAFEAISLAFGGTVRAAALLGTGILFAHLAVRARYREALVPACVFTGVGAALALIDPIRVRYLVRPPVTDVATSAIAGAAVAGALLTVAAITIAWAGGRLLRHDDPHGARIRWGFAAGFALYGATATVLSAGLAASPDQRGFLAGHVLVTLSWTVGALVLLLRHLDSTPLRVAGLVLVGAAVAKLVLFDLSSLSGIPRVLVFLGAGLVLLAAGARYAALVSDRTRHSAPAEPVVDPTPVG